MKKIFALSLALLAFAACNKNDRTTDSSLVDVSYTVATSVAAKASADNDGVAANVNRYICEVYIEESQRYIRKVNIVEAGTKETTFNLKLVKGQSYDVLFWADCADGESDKYYNTASGLKSVAVVKPDSLKYSDERDAFSGNHSVVNVAEGINKTIPLTRPFAQVNVITKDINDIRESELAAALLPNVITVSFEAPSAFNVLTGEASGNAAYSYSDVPYSALGVEKDELTQWTLSMNYVLAPADESKISKIVWSASHDSNELTSVSFESIPFRRNFRTNIIGELLTNAAVYNVEVRPAWSEPEKNEEK